MRKIFRQNLVVGVMIGAVIGLSSPALADTSDQEKSEAQDSAQDDAQTDSDDNGDPPRSNTGGHSKGAFVSNYDANGDGKVSTEEFLAKRTEKYQGLDLNKDGKVEEGEYVGEFEARMDRSMAKQRAAQMKQAHVRYGVLDTDHDKNMTIDEFHESSNRMFKRLDSNEDGIVDDRDTAEYF